MLYGNFTPFVRFARRIQKPPAYPQFLCAYDHRFIYMISGEMEIAFEKETFFMKAGSVMIFQPATPYKLTNNQTKGNEYIIVNFDFTDIASGSSVPRAPETINSFYEKPVFSLESFPPFHKPFFAENVHCILPVLEEICAEMNAKDEYSAECASALMKNIILRLIRIADAKIMYQSRTENIAEQIKGYIDLHYAENITNISIAKEFGYHPYYINSFFVKFFHITLHGYITSCRLRAAQDLLLDSNLSIGEIAYKCGFKNEAYFSESFKKNLGVQPSKLRDTRK